MTPDEIREVLRSHGEFVNPDVQGGWMSFREIAPSRIHFSGECAHDVLAGRIRIACGPYKLAGPGQWITVGLSRGEYIEHFCAVREGGKDGPMIAQGGTDGRTRRRETMGPLWILCIDVDRGISIQNAVNAVRKLGLLAVIWHSHSSGSTVSRLAASKYYRMYGANAPITVTNLQELLRNEDKLERAAIDSIYAVEIDKAAKELSFRHASLEKFRVVLFLKTPFDPSDFSDPGEANRVWGQISTAASDVGLKLRADPSTKDINRASYLQSKPTGTPDRPTYVNLGGLLDWRVFTSNDEPTPPAPKAKPRTRPIPNAVSYNDKTRRALATPELPRHLIRWVRKHGKSFKLASALDYFSPEIMGSSAKQGKGLHFKECPFNDSHSDPSKQDAAAYACDAQFNGSGFQARCMHAGCCDRDRLHFVAQLVSTGHLPFDALHDPRFLIGGSRENLPLHALGDGPGLGGFCRPLEAIIQHYYKTFGANANAERLIATLQKAIATAPKTNRTEDEIIRYSSSRFLTNLIRRSKCK